MPTAEVLARQMRAARERWVELPAEGAVTGLRVKLRRPPEAEFAKLREGVSVEHVCACVVDWDRFTEAALLGPEVGADEPVEFDAALWAEYARDRVGVVTAVADALAAAVSEHISSRQDAAKN